MFHGRRAHKGSASFQCNNTLGGTLRIRSDETQPGEPEIIFGADKWKDNRLEYPVSRNATNAMDRDWLICRVVPSCPEVEPVGSSPKGLIADGQSGQSLGLGRVSVSCSGYCAV